MSGKTKEQISAEVDRLIREEDCKSRGVLTPLKMADGFSPMPMPEEDEELDEDELDKQSYYDWIAWYFSLDWLPVLSIPVKQDDAWFPPIDLDESGAFNTLDFKRICGWKPNREAYERKQIYERLRDLAETYSCLTDEASKKHVKAIYDEEVHFTFKEKHDGILRLFKNKAPGVYKDRAVKELAKLRGSIMESEKIWRETAFTT